MTDNQTIKLPNNWTWKTLGDVANYLNGRAFKPSDWNDKGLPIVRIQNLNKDKSEYNFTEESFDNRFFIQNGDLLFAWSASLGAYIWNGGDAWLNQHIFKVVPYDNIYKIYLFYSLTTFVNQLYAKSHGSGMVHVTKKVFEDTPILVPPLPEQQKIVQKIESLFTELETGTKALKTALTQLKIYRQAVLNHFLTNDSWKMVKLGDVCDRIFDGPFGSNLKSSDYTSSGVQVVRLENIGFMEFFEEKETFVSEDKYQSLIKHEVFEGDIIFSSFIGDYIRTTILPNLKYKAIAKADCFCVRQKEKLINKQFLTFVLSSIRTQKILVLAVHGATRPRINTTQLKTFSFPLPSLKTQTQIVSEIEKRMAGADVLEASLKTQLINAENLRQSILKRAFEGKLV